MIVLTTLLHAGFLMIVLSTVLLALNISIPNELKGFFFYAQVSSADIVKVKVQNSQLHDRLDILYDIIIVSL